MNLELLRGMVVAAAGALAAGPGCGPAEAPLDPADTGTGGETPMPPSSTSGAPTASVGDTGYSCEPSTYEREECIGPPGSFTTGATGVGDTGTGDTGTGTGTSGHGETGVSTGTSGEPESPVPGCPSGWNLDDCGRWTLESSPPYLKDGECCYLLLIEDTCCGRPFVVSGQARVADTVAGPGWAIAAGTPRPVAPGVARRLAAAWLADAADEHAAVAAFSRFLLDLLALGAPSWMVAQAQHAVGEEIEHARLCYGLGSFYAAEELGPGPLDVSDHAARGALQIVSAAVAEGCVGETLAAAQAARARDAAVDPLVRATLSVIARDEARHAALAWRFVRWSLEAHPELRRPIRDVFRSALSTAPGLPASAGFADASLREHGRIPPAELVALFEETLESVVRPGVDALFRPTPRPARGSGGTRRAR